MPVMKKFFTLIFFVGFHITMAQEFASKPLFMVNGQISFGQSKTQVVNILGSPTSEINDYNEIDDVPMTVMLYGESKIYIEDEKLVGFDIQDASLYITYDNLTLSFNDVITKIQSKFPQRYSEDYGKAPLPGHDYSIRLPLKAMANSTTEIPIDESVRVLFNITTSKITGIRHEIE